MKIDTIWSLLLLCILQLVVISIAAKYEIQTESEMIDKRRLQFENMFETNQARGRKRKSSNNHKFRSMAMTKYIEDIKLSSDRYHLWWTGPPESVSNVYSMSPFSASHNASSNAVFAMAIKQGHTDKVSCSSPNDFKLYLGTLRKYFQGDIVLAVQKSVLTDDVVRILKHFNVIVYEISSELCSMETQSIFCGSVDERVPASVFRYFFYEIWSLFYSENSLIMLTDFRDVIFQGNPFDVIDVDEWKNEYQLALFQESYPNMIINKCSFNRKIMYECYGEEGLRKFGKNVIISSGGMIGTRDGIAIWSRYMTAQLQEAPGRMVETRCLSGGIEHSFINYLVYGHKLRSLLRIRIFLQGDGPMNSLGGLRPDTVIANITGDLRHFWKVLNEEGHVLNWNGQKSAVVHQLDHYLDELVDIAQISSTKYPYISKEDFAWQGLATSRCLWGCRNSPIF